MNCLQDIVDVKSKVGTNNFAHIYPFFEYKVGKEQCWASPGRRQPKFPKVSLVLANHLYNAVPGYFDMTIKHMKTHDLVIVDNGAFEGETLTINELISVVKSLHDQLPMCKFAVVAPDYPGESSIRTIASAAEFHDCLCAAGLRSKVFLFFVPQGERGDIDDYVEALRFAAESPAIDGVCFSILASPIAVYGTSMVTDFSKNARIVLLEHLFKEHRELMSNLFNNKYIHCLGLFNYPAEVFHLPYGVNSFDSAAPLKIAYYYALNSTTVEMKNIYNDRTPKVEIDVIRDSEEVLNTVFGSETATKIFSNIVQYLADRE